MTSVPEVFFLYIGDLPFRAGRIFLASAFSLLYSCQRDRVFWIALCRMSPPRSSFHPWRSTNELHFGNRATTIYLFPLFFVLLFFLLSLVVRSKPVGVDGGRASIVFCFTPVRSLFHPSTFFKLHLNPLAFSLLFADLRFARRLPLIPLSPMSVSQKSGLLPPPSFFS